MNTLSYAEIPYSMSRITAEIKARVDAEWKGWWAYPWNLESDCSLAAILTITPTVEGLAFLDLGCGSNPLQGGADAPCGDLSLVNDGHYPRLPMIMQILGAKVMGIDHGDYIEGYFPFTRRNLCQDGSLNFVPDHSIDLAHAGYLFSSPTLRKLGHSSEELQKALLPQLERVVKPDGYFVHSGMSSEYEDAFAIIVASMTNTSVDEVNRLLYGKRP